AGSAGRWRPACALGRPVLALCDPDRGDRARDANASSAEALEREELREDSSLASSNYDNGTSPGSAQGSPAGSAGRWRPACALGRPVLALCDPDRGDRARDANASSAEALEREELGKVSSLASSNYDNGTSPGSAQGSPAGSAGRWRPACALGRPVS